MTAAAMLSSWLEPRPPTLPRQLHPPLSLSLPRWVMRFLVPSHSRLVPLLLPLLLGLVRRPLLLVLLLLGPQLLPFLHRQL